MRVQLWRLLPATLSQLLFDRRMMATMLGANAAMEMGAAEKALRLYKTVLKVSYAHFDIKFYTMLPVWDVSSMTLIKNKCVNSESC